MLTFALQGIEAYIPVAAVIVFAGVFIIANLIMTQIIGPKAQGAVKGIPYEAGMDPIGSARKQFNIRFYILAMTFLVFDVEIIFLYPWAVTYTQLEPGSAESALFLGRILFFIATSIIAYVYAWKKGALDWE